MMTALGIGCLMVHCGCLFCAGIAVVEGYSRFAMLLALGSAAMLALGINFVIGGDA